MSRKTKTTDTKEEAKPARVPKLRFPEFREGDEWEERTLGSICSFASGGTPSKDNPEYWNGSIPWVSASSMYDLVVEKADHYVTPLAIGKGTRIAKKGSILILVRGSMLFNRVPICIAGIDVAFNQDVKALDVDTSIDTRFLLYQLSAFQARFPINETGIGAGKIELDHLKGFELFIPTLPEQQKIASCLSSVDEMMAAQARKVAALKTHKKGLMQQLFPREGETQPRLRFPEFKNAGEWEPTSLGDVARLRNGYAFKSAEYVDDGSYQIITIANVQQGNLAIESTKRIATLPSDIQEHQVLSRGDILISMTGNVGRVCRVTAEGLLLNQRVGKLIPEEIDATFFYQLLQRDEFRNTMQLKAAGGAQGNLSGGDITEYAFSAPTEPDEQQRIAACLSSLDALITAETQKHEVLKIHKKGLMQQLFPSPEGFES